MRMMSLNLMGTASTANYPFFSSHGDVKAVHSELKMPRGLCAGDLSLSCPLVCAKTIIMIKQVKFLGVCVSDQERALRFYTEKLGLTVKTDQPMGPQRWIELEIPGAETGVVLFTPEGQQDRIGSFVNTSLACDDLEATYEELKSRGVEFSGPPQEQPWGKFAILKDPDGNSFVLSSAT